MYFNFLSNPRIAIIGDIKESKKIDNRSEVQKKLSEVLKDINRKYHEDISSKFIITLGDEFQGLLCNGVNTMEIIFEIERQMYPVKLRFGIGIGEITTDINIEMAIGADGPGYHMARKAIEFIKDDEKRKQTNPADIRIEIDGNHKPLITLMNTILSLMTVIKETWSNRQREIIWDMLEHQDNQMNTAKRLEIKQSSVQKSLSRGKYYAYKDAFDTIGQVLKEIRREDV